MCFICGYILEFYSPESQRLFHTCSEIPSISSPTKPQYHAQLQHFFFLDATQDSRTTHFIPNNESLFPHNYASSFQPRAGRDFPQFQKIKILFFSSLTSRADDLTVPTEQNRGLLGQPHSKIPINTG